MKDDLEDERKKIKTKQKLGKRILKLRKQGKNL